MRFVLASLLCLVLACGSFGTRTRDARVKATHYMALDRAGSLMAKGDTARGMAQLDLAQNKVALRLAVVDTTLLPEERARFEAAADAAMNLWHNALGGNIDLTMAGPGEEVNVRLSSLKAEPCGSHAHGRATWIKTLVQQGPQTFLPLVSSDIAVQKVSAQGRLLDHDQLTYAIAHEIGHLLGLDDTPHSGELMGPARIHAPILTPAEREVSALLQVKEDAEMVARIYETNPVGGRTEPGLVALTLPRMSLIEPRLTVARSSR